MKNLKNFLARFRAPKIKSFKDIFFVTPDKRVLTVRCAHANQHRLAIICDCGIDLIGVIEHGTHCGSITFNNRWRWTPLQPRENFTGELEKTFGLFGVDTFEAILLAQETLEEIDEDCRVWDNYVFGQRPEVQATRSRQAVLMSLLAKENKQWEKKKKRASKEKIKKISETLAEEKDLEEYFRSH